MKKSFMLALGLVLSLGIGSTQAFAHGSMKPEHGGIVKVEQELTFELVRDADKVRLYLKDHGKAYSTDALSGSVMLLAAGDKSEVELVPAGGNQMTANIHIPDGAKVLVRVQEGDHHPVTVRYSY